MTRRRHRFAKPTQATAASDRQIAEIELPPYCEFKRYLDSLATVTIPFAEQRGIPGRPDDSGRVRGLLKIMGGTIPVQVLREYAIVA